MTELNGLTKAQAAERLARFGPNDIRPRHRWVWLKRLFEVLSEPTLLVLVVVLVFYISMGSRGEALLLSVFVGLVVVITYVEEARTEGAVAALSALASPRALALRDGVWTRLSGQELVPDDLMQLNEGDRIAADGEIIEAHDLRVDESLLTGESQGVWKNALPDSPPAERQVYAGSLMLQGQALARVTATGLSTRVGQISRHLSEIEPEQTPFQKSTAQLVRVLGGVAVVACLTVIFLAKARGATLTQAILQGLTLAIATVPEELPVVLTVFLAMGARRIAREGVLASRVPAIETLGAITLLAVDKTGTLTRNEMKLAAVVPAPGKSEGELLEAASRASEMEPFDPMEKQIRGRHQRPAGHIAMDYSLFGRPPRMGHIWDDGKLGAKGALEGVLEHCRIDEATRAWALSRERELAKQGLRVLGCAQGQQAGPAPEALPQNLEFVGLVAFEDPLREGVPQAIAEAQRAGMRVVMMTGDSLETATAIGAKLGIGHGLMPVSGAELEAEPHRIDEWARERGVFARLAPEQKLILVQAWARQNQVVGMTGDGVNDAPALTQAHVGIAMGARGTDVAREAADLILVDDSFNSLVNGVRRGREVTRRILITAGFVLAVHVPIIVTVLACLFLDAPPMVEAAQIAFLELFIGPTVSVVFERTRDGHDVMADPPRDPKAPLISLATAQRAIFQGLIISAAVLGVYFTSIWSHGDSVPQARAEAFLTMMLANFMLCFTLLSEKPIWRAARWTNISFWAVSAAVMGALTLLVRLPATASIFHMAWLEPSVALRCGLIAAAATLWVEIPRAFKARHALAPGP